MTNEQKKTVSISHLPELRERLNNAAKSPEQAKAEHLFMLADKVLSDPDATFKTRIGGHLATVSRYTCEIEDNGIKYYARLVRNASADQSASDTQILFDTDNKPASVSTKNPAGIPFHEEVDGSISLFMNRGVEPIGAEDPAYQAYLQTAEAIIGNISDQHDAHLSEVATEEEARKHRVRRGLGAAARGTGRALASPVTFFTNRERRSSWDTYKTKGSYRRAWAVGLTAAAAISYGHLPFDSKEDAEINGFPMPYPVEWFVDWANISDHQATAFGEPAGAMDITHGQPVGEIPTLTNYRTEGVPDTSHIPSLDNVYSGELSKPGLWESNFDADYNPETGWARRDAQFVNGCYTIEGDYTDGKTKVFTQTPGVNDMITLDIPNSWTLEVCEKDGSSDDFEGSLFIWQDSDK